MAGGKNILKAILSERRARQKKKVTMNTFFSLLSMITIYLSNLGTAQLSLR